MASMDSCPPEVLLAICSFLHPWDVAAIRLVRKDLAVIGAHYLVERIRFHASTASVERLTSISQNHFFRQSVKTLFWEAAQLRSVLSIDTVRSSMQAHNMDGPMPTPPSPGATAREKRLYERNIRKWYTNPENISEVAVKRQYRQCQKALNDQDDAEGLLMFGGEALMRAIGDLPKLKEIWYDNTPRCPHTLSNHFVERFDDWEIPPSFDLDTENSIYQFRFLLAAIAGSGTEVEKLVVRRLAPAVFEDDHSIPGLPTKIGDAMRTLKDINIHFRLNEHHEHYSLGGCFGILNKGGLQNMLSSAAQLQRLSITFDDNPEGAATSLANVLGDHVWRGLRSITISNLTTTEDLFMECLLRQPQLTDLNFGFMTFSKGSWENVVGRMQQELSLSSMDLTGLLISTDRENEFWDMEAVDFKDHHATECHGDSDDSDSDDEFRMTLGMEIEHYVVWGNKDFPNPFSEHDWISPDMMSID